MSQPVAAEGPRSRSSRVLPTLCSKADGCSSCAAEEEEEEEEEEDEERQRGAGAKLRATERLRVRSMAWDLRGERG